jgi:hypothetical protein
METEEIRAAITHARRACADADSIGEGGVSERHAIHNLWEAVSRLADATEELLAEREAFAGRLRRTPAKRAVESTRSTTVPTPSDPPAEFTPSPATDA